MKRSAAPFMEAVDGTKERAIRQGEREREFGHLSLWRRRRREAAPGVASNTLGSERQYAKCALRRALPPPADV